MRWILFFALIFSPNHIRVIYNSLDPTSIHEHLAFIELYPNTPEGEKSLDHLKKLLTAQSIQTLIREEDLKKAVQGMIHLVNKPDDEELPLLNEETLQFIEGISRILPNRKLKGFYARTEDEVLALPSDQIDLARGLFLSEMGPEQFQKIRSYEARLDLMALQLRVRTPPGSSDGEIINIMNRYIFEELGFRFPPHSTYSEDIDLYTFLPSVMDSRRGVCLGVSILYITLAQRLGLYLEMVTPPGHIYVRSQDINIETTARGVNLDSSVYLGVDTRSLEIRVVKEVIGMAHFNQASTFWRKNNPRKALECYSRAYPYLKDDPLLLELMGYNYLLAGDLETGKEYLEKVKDHLPEHAVSMNSVPQDYLNGKADVESLRAIYKEVTEKRSSILEKKQKIEETLARCPEFRAGWLSLAITHLQLHRTKEALQALKEVHRLDPNDATTEYYLAALQAERENYEAAWSHLRQAEKLTELRDHSPKALIQLRRELALIYPETVP